MRFFVMFVTAVWINVIMTVKSLLSASTFRGFKFRKRCLLHASRTYACDINNVQCTLRPRKEDDWLKFVTVFIGSLLVKTGNKYTGKSICPQIRFIF